VPLHSSSPPGRAGNRHGSIGRAASSCGIAVALIANHERHRPSQIDGSRLPPPCTAGAKSSRPIFRSGQSHLPLSTASSGIRKNAARRGRTRLGISIAHGSRQTEDARSAEGLRRAQNRSRLPGSCNPARTPAAGGALFAPPSTSAHLQVGGSTRGSHGCGVAVAKAEFSSSLGRHRTSVSSAAQALPAVAPRPAPQRQSARAGRRAELLQADSALQSAKHGVAACQTAGIAAG